MHDARIAPEQARFVRELKAPEMVNDADAAGGVGGIFMAFISLKLGRCKAIIGFPVSFPSALIQR